MSRNIDMERRGRGCSAMARRDSAARGSVTHGSNGVSSLVGARWGTARRGMAALGSIGLPRPGSSCTGSAGHGSAALAGYPVARHGIPRHDSAATDGLVIPPLGSARLVSASVGTAVTHGHGTSTLVPAALVWVHHGTAATEGLDWLGSPRFAMARQGSATRGSNGRACLGVTSLGSLTHGSHNIDHPRGSAAGGASGRRMSHRKGNPS